MIKIPTLEELQKLYCPIIDGKEYIQGSTIPEKEAINFLLHLKATFLCKKCGKCCEECKNIILSKEDFERISNHFNLSHSEFKRRFKLKFKKEHWHFSECPFFNKEKRLCKIYDIRPLVCKQFPYNASQVYDMKNGFWCYKPPKFCYATMLYYHYSHKENMPMELNNFFDKIPEEIKEKIRKEFIELGIKKIFEEEIGNNGTRN